MTVDGKSELLIRKARDNTNFIECLLYSWKDAGCLFPLIYFSEKACEILIIILPFVEIRKLSFRKIELFYLMTSCSKNSPCPRKAAGTEEIGRIVIFLLC